MIRGRFARKEAQKAAKEAARRTAAEAPMREAANLREQTLLAQKRAEGAAKQAQRLLMRSLRARGGGFFESDFLSSTTLGGEGVLG